MDNQSASRSDFLRLAKRVKGVETAAEAPCTVMPGAVMAWAGQDAPPGWLICDGALVSREKYAALFDAVGTAYGAGNGVTTFNIPNMRGRVPAGYYNADTAFDALGKTGGEKTHTLIPSEAPPVTINAYALASGGTQSAGYIEWGSGRGGGQYYTSGAQSQPHNNLPPYICMNYIIKY